MIFVTVGTHEQQFNRLIEYVDDLKQRAKSQEEFIIQTGYSTYEVKNCTHKKFFSHKEMEKDIADARIIITHGGPASFIIPLQMGKVPIVVPRKHEFGEHVNNHQVEFVEKIVEREKVIIPIFDIEELGDSINNYENIVANMRKKRLSNNQIFNEKLEKIVETIF